MKFNIVEGGKNDKSINFEVELTNSGLKTGMLKIGVWNHYSGKLHVESLRVTQFQLRCLCVDRESTLQVEDGYAGSECPHFEKMRRCVLLCFLFS